MKKKSPDLQFYAIFFAEDKYNYPRLSIFVRKDEGEAVPTILNDITVTVGNSGFIRLDFYGRKGSDHKQFSFDSSSYSPEQVVQKTLCLIAENDRYKIGSVTKQLIDEDIIKMGLKRQTRKLQQ